MHNQFFESIRSLTDAELVAKTKDLAGRERSDTSALVAHVAEIDTRDIHLREGYSSLFAYCRDALLLSEGEAYNRIEVARAARRFPVILRMLTEGALNLTNARLLAPHLTSENYLAVLASRHIRADVKRSVWARDFGSCAFVGQGGRRQRTGVRRVPSRPPVRGRRRGDGFQHRAPLWAPQSTRSAGVLLHAGLVPEQVAVSDRDRGTRHGLERGPGDAAPR
jgi:hypothetical protein